MVNSVVQIFCILLDLLSIIDRFVEVFGIIVDLSNFLCSSIRFVFFFLAALGLRCCVWASSSGGERGLLFVVVHGLLIVVASLVAEHGP